MPSSTSNSDPLVPSCAWGKTWMLALLLVAASLGVWEGMWRWRGFAPSVMDNVDLWVEARHRVEPKSVVLIGSSSIFTDIVPEVFAAEWNGSVPVQLGIGGASPLPILEDLAEDEAFSGLSIVDVPVQWTFDEVPIPQSSATEDRGREGRATEHVERYRATVTSPALRSEAYLRLWTVRIFAFRQPTLSLRRILDAVQRREWPRVPDAKMRLDRFVPLPMESTAPESEKWQPDPASVDASGVAPEERPQAVSRREEVLLRFARAVRRIRARGGEVVFVRLPVGEGLREFEQRRFPRHFYWDQLQARAQALSLEAGDYPELARFYPIDEEHLHAEDAIQFTRVFARILKREMQRRAEASAQAVGFNRGSPGTRADGPKE